MGTPGRRTQDHPSPVADARIRRLRGQSPGLDGVQHPSGPGPVAGEGSLLSDRGGSRRSRHRQRTAWDLPVGGPDLLAGGQVMSCPRTADLLSVASLLGRRWLPDRPRCPRGTRQEPVDGGGGQGRIEPGWMQIAGDGDGTALVGGVDDRRTSPAGLAAEACRCHRSRWLGAGDPATVLAMDPSTAVRPGGEGFRVTRMPASMTLCATASMKWVFGAGWSGDGQVLRAADPAASPVWVPGGIESPLRAGTQTSSESGGLAAHPPGRLVTTADLLGVEHFGGIPGWARAVASTSGQRCAGRAAASASTQPGSSGSAGAAAVAGVVAGVVISRWRWCGWP